MTKEELELLRETAEYFWDNGVEFGYSTSDDEPHFISLWNEWTAQKLVDEEKP